MTTLTLAQLLKSFSSFSPKYQDRRATYYRIKAHRALSTEDLETLIGKIKGNPDVILISNTYLDQPFPLREPKEVLVIKTTKLPKLINL